MRHRSLRITGISLMFLAGIAVMVVVSNWDCGLACSEQKLSSDGEGAVTSTGTQLKVDDEPEQVVRGSVTETLLPLVVSSTMETDPDAATSSAESNVDGPNTSTEPSSATTTAVNPTVTATTVSPTIVESTTSSTVSFNSGNSRPWEHNTGPTNTAVLRRVTGGLVIDTPGVTIENVDVLGKIDIKASNVTLRNFRVDAGMTFYGIHVRKGLTGVVIEHGEITNSDSAGVRCESACTLRRLHIHDHDSDGMKLDGSNGQSLVEYNFITRLGTGEGSHADGNQSVRGKNLTFRYNNFYMPYPGSEAHNALPRPPGVTKFLSNATFIIHDDTANILIEHNWLTGGNWTIYGSEGTTVRNNIFGRDNRDAPGAVDLEGKLTCSTCDGTANICNGPFDDWSRNTMEDGTPFGNNQTCP